MGKSLKITKVYSRLCDLLAVEGKLDQQLLTKIDNKAILFLKIHRTYLVNKIHQTQTQLLKLNRKN